MHPTWVPDMSAERWWPHFPIHPVQLDHFSRCNHATSLALLHESHSRCWEYGYRCLMHLSPLWSRLGPPWVNVSNACSVCALAIYHGMHHNPTARRIARRALCCDYTQ
jgi:hypothetical protein